MGIVECLYKHRTAPQLAQRKWHLSSIPRNANVNIAFLPLLFNALWIVLKIFIGTKTELYHSFLEVILSKLSMQFNFSLQINFVISPEYLTNQKHFLCCFSIPCSRFAQNSKELQDWIAFINIVIFCIIWGFVIHRCFLEWGYCIAFYRNNNNLDQISYGFNCLYRKLVWVASEIA